MITITNTPATAKVAKTSENNYIVEFEGKPITGLKFQANGKVDVQTGSVTDAIRYTGEEADEVVTSVGRGAQIIFIGKGKPVNVLDLPPLEQKANAKVTELVEDYRQATTANLTEFQRDLIRNRASGGLDALFELFPTLPAWGDTQWIH